MSKIVLYAHLSKILQNFTKFYTSQVFNNRHNCQESSCFNFGKRVKIFSRMEFFSSTPKISTRKENSYWKCVIPSCKGRAITSGDFIVEKNHMITQQIVLLSGPEIL